MMGRSTAMAWERNSQALIFQSRPLFASSNDRPWDPAAARNWGIRLARSPRVLLLGDDTPLRPGALARHLAPEFSHLGLQGRIDWDPRFPISDFMRFLAPQGPQFYFQGLAEGTPVGFETVLGSNLSAPTTWFREEPFDERFPNASMEDTELAYRWRQRGWTVHFSEIAGAWHHHHYETVEPFLQRQYRAGTSARYAIRKQPGIAWKVMLAPAIVTTLRFLRPRRNREQRWDLACRVAFFRGLLRRRTP